VSLTTANALKAWIEAGGLGVTVYRDRPPEGTAYPYVTVHEGISEVPSGTDNAFCADDFTIVEQVQVSLWQQWKDKASNAVTESYTLAAALRRLLNGAQLATAPTRVFGVRVTNRVRALDVDNDVVHDALTVDIDRDE
jgi:hypothetical protein